MQNLDSDPEEDQHTIFEGDDGNDADYLPRNNAEESDAEVEDVIAEINEGSDSENGEEELVADVDEQIDSEEVDQVLDAFYVGKDGTKWKKTKPNLQRVPAHNIIREPSFVGPKPNTRSLSDVNTFCLLFNASMQNIICRHTNRKAEKEYYKWNAENPNKKVLIWDALQEEELLAYIGLLIVIGSHRSNYEAVDQLWKKNAFPLYRATMSVRRFYNITRFIRFDFDVTRQTRIETDKAAPISEIFEMLNANLKGNFRPYNCITIDEQLFPFRGRTKFTQYIPSKPAKYGIKIWWACDSDTAYPLNGQIYTGKIGNIRDKNQGERVVKDLVVPYKNTGRNVTMDNFFTSLPLAKDLLGWNLSMVGTMKKNKRCIPVEFKASKTREVLSTAFGFGEKMVLCSYVPKKDKAVVLLSTQHNDDSVSGPKLKPDIILYYNKTKGAVDTMDKMLSQYTTKRKTNRWPLAMFFNIIDTAGLAAYIIFTKNNPSSKHNVRTSRRREFLQELGEHFCIPLINKRAQIPRAMSHFPTRSAVECILGISVKELREPQNVPFIPDDLMDRDGSGRLTQKGQCSMCYREEKRKRPSRKVCVQCKKPVCQMHSLTQTKCEECHTE